MTELEMRTQQIYDGMHNYATRGIPDEYMDDVERNLRRYCIYRAKHGINSRFSDSDYIEEINSENKSHSRLDVESRLMYFGKDEHWDNLLMVRYLISCVYVKNEKRGIFRKKRLSYKECKGYFSYALAEAHACPFYIRNEVLEEINIIWRNMLDVASLSGCICCIYMWFKFPQGPVRYKL